MAALGISSDVRAQTQSHGLGGIQARHYDRHDYMPEKPSATEAHGDDRADPKAVRDIGQRDRQQCMGAWRPAPPKQAPAERRQQSEPGEGRGQAEEQPANQVTSSWRQTRTLQERRVNEHHPATANDDVESPARIDFARRCQVCRMSACLSRPRVKPMNHRQTRATFAPLVMPNLAATVSVMSISTAPTRQPTKPRERCSSSAVAINGWTFGAAASPRQQCETRGLRRHPNRPVHRPNGCGASASHLWPVDAVTPLTWPAAAGRCWLAASCCTCR